jgi:hypothetical protein
VKLKRDVPGRHHPEDPGGHGFLSRKKQNVSREKKKFDK